jgi:hypothetical protein
MDAGRLSERILSEPKKDVIVEELPVRNSRQEIAVVAMLRIGVPKAFLVKQFQSHGGIMLSENSSRFGVFGRPPNFQDMIRFQFPRSDLKVMPGCRIGDCKIKLSGIVIQTLEKFNWSNKDSTNKINVLFRQDFSAYAERYLAKGRNGLVTYADKKEPQSLAHGFERILGQSSYINTYAPELCRYLINFPQDTLENAVSYIYWSLDEFGLRPVTEITHATIYNPSTFRATLIAEKQIYASHYFWARLKFSVVIEDNDDSGNPGVFLICSDHSLFDENLGRIHRRILSRSVRNNFQFRLRSMRSRLEAKFRTG